MHSLLADWPIVVTHSVAWGDMDSFGHVNNVVYLSYFERARIELLTRAGWMEQKATRSIGPIVASIACRYRKPLTYPDQLWVASRVGELGDDRVTIEQIIVSQHWDAIAAEGPAVMVNFDYTRQSKAVFSADLKTKLQALMSPRGAS